MTDDFHNLPPGWERTTLREMIELKYGKGLPAKSRSSSGSIPVYGSNGIVGRHNKAFTSAPVIIVGRKGSVGEVHISQTPCWPIDTTYFVDNFPPALDAKFLYRFLSSQRIRDLDRSTAVPGLNRGDLYGLPLPLPPPGEQQRIVAKIEALFEQSRTAREALDRIPPLLKKFRQAVLAAAFRGDLARDWRDQHLDDVPAIDLLDNLRKLHAAHAHRRGRFNAAPPTEGVHILDSSAFPESWALADLAELCEPTRPITYGILKPGPDRPEGVPYVRVADMQGERIVVNGIRRTSKTIDDAYRRSRLKGGDILLSIRGTVGRVCLVPWELDSGNITQDTARISVHPSVNAEYVALCLRNPVLQGIMRAAIRGVAVRGINIGDVRALQIPIPPRSEQDEITARVKALLSQADSVDAAVSLARRRADKLEQSILARAFRGGLVPQDPTDEPPAFCWTGSTGTGRRLVASKARWR